METQLLHCAAWHGSSHTVHFFERKEGALCWDVWLDDEYLWEAGVKDQSGVCSGAQNEWAVVWRSA